MAWVAWAGRSESIPTMSHVPAPSLHTMLGLLARSCCEAAKPQIWTVPDSILSLMISLHDSIQGIASQSLLVLPVQVHSIPGGSSFTLFQLPHPEYGITGSRSHQNVRRRFNWTNPYSLKYCTRQPLRSQSIGFLRSRQAPDRCPTAPWQIQFSRKTNKLETLTA